MKTHTFYAQNGEFELNGVLIISNTVNKIVFDTNLEGFIDSDIKERNISDIPNFIASYIARCDNDLFNTVMVDGKKTVRIKRNEFSESKDTMVVYYHLSSMFNPVIKPEQSLKVINTDGKEVSVELGDLGLTSKTVPVGFAYTNDALLNEILKLNQFEYDYDRKINNKLLKIIKVAKQKSASNSDAKYILVDKYLSDLWFDTDNTSRAFKYFIPIYLIK